MAEGVAAEGEVEAIMADHTKKKTDHFPDLEPLNVLRVHMREFGLKETEI